MGDALIHATFWAFKCRSFIKIEQNFLFYRVAQYNHVVVASYEDHIKIVIVYHPDDRWVHGRFRSKKMKSGLCQFCKGEMKEGKTKFMARVQNQVIVMKDVPAWAGERCGEVEFLMNLQED